ncbi:MAG TPA: ankyrin repeat domain-containing protein [Vicinamibacterales bacterium]|nr:ankyrin repeat domain-containing protein [Vicinamibacterales bacterium]
MVAALPYSAPLAEYEREADALYSALQKGDQAVQWRFKWEHPRFRGKTLDVVQSASLGLDDARLVIAREYGFTDWPHLAQFADAVRRDEGVARFEAAVDAVVGGDLDSLRAMVRAHPDLPRARSMRRHRATLLHYVAANGVEGSRQKTPKNVIDIAKLLLESGAEVDALADMYDEQCTTLSMLVSSSPPADAGQQIALTETLLDYGAALDGAGSKWTSALLTALTFGFLPTAHVLAKRGAPVTTLAAAAGLGRVHDTVRLLSTADAESRHLALALAAQLGHAAVVQLLLDRGEDPNRYNPEGCHAHATPLHQAVWANHMDVVQVLVDRGARLDIRDRIYRGTPLDWAKYGGRTAIAEYLREHGAS